MLLNKKVKEFIVVFGIFIKNRIMRHFVYLGISLVLGYFLGYALVLTDLEDIMSTLQNISAAVFTLAGIWIAYSYPQAIAAYTSPNKVSVIPTDETKRIEKLVLIVLTSAFVLSSLLILNLVSLLVSKLVTNSEHLYFFNLFSVSLVFYFVFLQLKAIFVVMITNISFVNELHEKKTETKAHKDL